MKLQKVLHEFGIGSVGEEDDEAEGLHEVSVCYEDDAAAGIERNEATDGFAGAIQELGEGLGTGAVDVGWVGAIPEG